MSTGGDIDVDVDAAITSPTIVTGKPRRGRPKGTTKSFLAWAAQNQTWESAKPVTETPKPGSIEHARLMRHQKIEKRRQEQLQLQASGQELEAVIEL